jgi:hypothetical protein
MEALGPGARARQAPWRGAARHGRRILRAIAVAAVREGASAFSRSQKGAERISSGGYSAWSLYTLY